jgi:hypothetical protein
LRPSTTPRTVSDKLVGREAAIFAERDRKSRPPGSSAADAENLPIPCGRDRNLGGVSDAWLDHRYR